MEGLLESIVQYTSGRLAQLVRAPALQAGQISSKSLLRLRLLSSSHPWPAPKLIQNYKLRLIHVRGMRRKRHPYRLSVG